MKALRVDRSGSVTKHQIQDADRPMELQCSHLHVAGGCAPTTDTLNLVAAGVATDARASFPVNKCLETNVLEI
ncbi:hypothetical protein QUA13_29320 [Microcoleus sp. S28C3]|uniref:hypothetical protein n=1 Tax=Microcoleus sp. S28C3 TaxID=3055414 RepID=UPI002FD382BB